MTVKDHYITKKSKIITVDKLHSRQSREPYPSFATNEKHQH